MINPMHHYSPSMTLVTLHACMTANCLSLATAAKLTSETVLGSDQVFFKTMGLVVWQMVEGSKELLTGGGGVQVTVTEAEAVAGEQGLLGTVPEREMTNEPGFIGKAV